MADMKKVYNDLIIINLYVYKTITSDGWCLYVHNEIQLSHEDKYSWHLLHLTWYICPDLGNDLGTSWEFGNLGQLDAWGPFIYYVSTFINHNNLTSFLNILWVLKISNYSMKILWKCNVEKDILTIWRKNPVFWWKHR